MKRFVEGEDGRAPVRNHQALDGFDALPDQDDRAREHQMSLHVLAYNLKRVMSVLGIAETMKVMQLARA